MSAVTVSVVMPVYNGEGCLRECLDSLCSQTLRDIEIICVDDGSTDGSLAILDEYASKDSRIRVIAQQNAGAAAARNRGIDIASGEYLSVLDSDDRFEPVMLEKMVAAARSAAAQIVICRCDGFEDGTEKPVPMLWSLQKEFIPSKVFSPEQVGDALFFFTQGWAWDKLYLMSFVREHQLRFQNLKSSNDMLFTFLSLALAQRITTVSGVYVHQRRGRDTSISRTRQRNCDCFYHALTGLRDELERRDLMEQYRKAFENLCVTLSMWHFSTLSGDRDCFFFLYDKLREEYLPELGIGCQPEDYFLEGVRDDYRRCLEIIEKTSQDYLFDRAAAVPEQTQQESDPLSWKIGRALTWLPRTAAKGLRAVRSAGLGYTLKTAWRTLLRGSSRK